MKNSLRIHKWTHNEFNIFILGVLTHPRFFMPHLQDAGAYGIYEKIWSLNTSFNHLSQL